MALRFPKEISSDSSEIKLLMRKVTGPNVVLDSWEAEAGDLRFKDSSI